MGVDLPYYYPINDFGPVMKGMVIGGLGIVHVFLAQFAIGGGAIMCYFQWLAHTGRCAAAQQFLDSYFKALVLISFVLGALTGVGMWFAAIQISPRTIGLMVDEFHWVWAIEWTFFALEVVAGYMFYRYGGLLLNRRRMQLLLIYTAAAWFSLFWINGILSWQLTPGAWTADGKVWSGFFNTSFWPSLFYRSVTSLTIASLAACVVINTMTGLDLERKRQLINRAAHLLTPMVLMPALGVWYLQAIPADSRSWLLGGSPAMTMFVALSVGASLLIGLYALVALVWQRLYINGATAALLCALALAATAGGEFVREGSRKPYTVRQTLYANSITREEVVRLRAVGSVTADPYPLRNAGAYLHDQLRLGARVYRFQCSVCHTVSGANGLTHLTGSWTLDQKRMNIAKLQFTKPFMPPFAGTAEELEALVQYLTWENASRPSAWDVSNDRTAIANIEKWLLEAGPERVGEGEVHSRGKSARAPDKSGFSRRAGTRGSLDMSEVAVPSMGVGE
ncbi:MAG: c-type cytochrome [Planctomycetes bacterium]|nr:c-type cytochrome [Planctomycetota bacterium]